MNVTCENCQKRYSIADDKVRGKSVKIRCKNCQTVLSIQGPPEGSEAGPKNGRANGASSGVRPLAARALDPGVLWYAMIGGKQQGPLDVRALQSKITAGEISLRTHLWHQALPEWKRARDLGEVASLFPAQPAASKSGDGAMTQRMAAVAAPERAIGNGRAAPEPTASPAVGAEDSITGEAWAPDPIADRALSTLQAPSPEILTPKAKAEDPLGELFSDAYNPMGPEGAPASKAAARAKGKAAEDPFAALGDIDPSMLPPPGEATRFFIAKAGVNKRNPPWKIALAVSLFIGAPVGILFVLSEMHIVPLEVTRVDSEGREIKESIFSPGGVSGLGDYLTGKHKKKAPVSAPPRVAAAPPVHRPKADLAAADPERGPKVPPPNAPSYEEMAKIYGEKTDTGPRVRKDEEPKLTDSSTGGLAAEAVAKVVSQSQPAFQQCIEATLRKNPGFRGGKIDITVTIGSSGIVKRAEIDKKDIDLSDLGGCLKARVKRMQFPAFAGDEEAEVHIPLILTTTL